MIGLASIISNLSLEGPKFRYAVNKTVVEKIMDTWRHFENVTSLAVRSSYKISSKIFNACTVRNVK